MTSVEYTISISQVVVMSTATCITPTKQTTPDPTCTITPSLATAAALETPAYAKIRRVPVDRAQRIQERKERLGVLQKRSPGRVFFAFDAEYRQLMISMPQTPQPSR